MLYKVVERQTRWGTNWMVFKHQHSKDKEIYLKGLKFRKEHPEFFPHYFRGKIIKAVPGSLGIMCFSRRDYAEQFMKSLCLGEMAIIVRVKPLGIGRSIDTVIPVCASCPWNLEFQSSNYFAAPSPKGTVGFEAVKVLE